MVDSQILRITNGSQLSSSTYSKGKAGNVSVHAETLAIDGQNSSTLTGITSAAQAGSTGNGGKLMITAKNMALASGAQVLSSTFAKGNAGILQVSADTLTLDGQGDLQFGTVITSGAQLGSSGDGGKVVVNAKNLNIINGAQVSSGTFSKGNSGNIHVKAAILKIDGKSNPGATGILSNAEKGSGGNAGKLVIEAGELNVTEGGQLASTTFSKGNAGAIHIKANTLTLDGHNTQSITLISSGAEPGSTGRANDIIIHAKTLNMFRYSAISSSTASNKQGGAVDIAASLINLSDRAYIASLSTTNAKGGDITIGGDKDTATYRLKLDDYSLISAQNFGSGKAGTINIMALDALVLKNNSGVSVETNEGNAGNININTGNLFYALNKSFLTTSAASGKGNGGNITIIDPTFVVLNNSVIVANASEGRGGNINISSKFFLPSSGSLVQASSEFGLQGSVSINSANSNIAGSISVLPTVFMDASALILEDCGLHAEENSSSLMASSMQGLVKPSPDNFVDYLPSALGNCENPLQEH